MRNFSYKFEYQNLEITMSILLLNGPPFSPLFWEKVQERLSKYEQESICVNWIEHSGKFEKLMPFLLKTCKQNKCTQVVAHGLAVPLALELAQMKPELKITLSNGPTDHHRLFSLLSKLPKIVLHPSLSLPSLASSIAFRRLVINPYVMNRDTIALLSKDILDNPKTRQHIQEYLKELQNWKAPKNLTSQEISLIWGTEDFLFPTPKPDQTSFKASLQLIGGGAHFHPVERPWAMADQIIKNTMTQMS